MDALNFIGALAAILLLLELLVLLVVVAALCAGLGFGMRFVDKRSSPVLDKVNAYIEQARGYRRKGLRLAVKPIIAIHALGESLGVTVGTLIEQARNTE